MAAPRLHRTRHAARFSLVAYAALAGSAAQAIDETRLRAVVDDVIRPLMARHDIPGMAVGVVVDGRASVFNYGVMSRRSGAPVTERTRFEIGSVTKPFTATLAAYAQSTRTLSLADHPGRHVPELRGSALDRATLLQLATYTAGGLPLQFPDDVAANDAAALAYLRGWQPAQAPGTVRQYSNPSLGLLGLATARALGQDYATALETRLFPAFGMAHSHVNLPDSARPDYAWGHRDGRELRMQPGPLGAPAYGVVTTAADLLRFVQAHFAPDAAPPMPQPLPPALRAALEATRVGHVYAGPIVQGLGWDQFPWPVSREWLLGGNAREMAAQPQPVLPVGAAAAAGDARLFSKTGSTGGFGAYVAFVPAQRVGLVLLANRNYPNPARIEAAWALLQAVTAAD